MSSQRDWQRSLLASLKEGGQAYARAKFAADHELEIGEVERMMVAGVADIYESPSGWVVLLLDGVTVEEARAAARVVVSIQRRQVAAALPKRHILAGNPQVFPIARRVASRRKR